MMNEKKLDPKVSNSPMNVIIVCHTEFGFVHNQRIIPQKKAKQGVELGVSNLNKITEKYGAKVTYAICPEVVESFPKNSKHEIGLHIHPGWEKSKHDRFEWHVGDAYLREHCQQSNDSSVLKDHTYLEQEEMIKTGKDYIEDKLGFEPKSFVAGRWSINNDTTKALVNAGITHDCSASSHSKMNHYDWSKLPRICMPYNPSESDYQKEGSMPLLIVPISQYYPSGNVNPEATPTVGASWLKACFSEYYRLKVPLFHICLHSPSMTDPYYISVMGNLLGYISKHKNINFEIASNIGKIDATYTKTKISPYLMAANTRVMKAYFRSRREKANRRLDK